MVNIAEAGFKPNDMLPHKCEPKKVAREVTFEDWYQEHKDYVDTHGGREKYRMHCCVWELSFYECVRSMGEGNGT